MEKTRLGFGELTPPGSGYIFVEEEDIARTGWLGNSLKTITARFRRGTREKRQEELAEPRTISELANEQRALLKSITISFVDIDMPSED